MTTIGLNPKKQATLFKKQYGIEKTSYDVLKKAAISQGYTVVEFNHIFNDENVATLIDSLKLSDNILRTRGFTYADSNYRIVFVHEDLSEDEKIVVLSHELGHIYCNHMSNTPIIGKDVQEEHEANEFSHYLLNQSIAERFLLYVLRHKKAVAVFSITLLFLIAGIVILKEVQKEKSYYGEYYITDSGNKYHEKECIFVKDKTNVHRMTQEEFDSGDYEPCHICLP